MLNNVSLGNDYYGQAALKAAGRPGMVQNFSTRYAPSNSANFI